MSEKVKRVVTNALKRNTFTAGQNIEVYVQGRHVALMGTVESIDLIFEAIATVEAVHPRLKVHNRLTVGAPVAQLEKVVV